MVGTLRSRCNARFFALMVVSLLILSGLLSLGAAPAMAATDTQAPSLVDFTISPAEVNTAAGPATITLSAKVTDDVSGVNNGNVSFKSASGTQYLYSSFDATKRSSGSAQNGTFTWSLTVPRYSEKGTWTVSSFSIYDGAAHSLYRSASDLTSAGFPSSFEQTAPGDADPPVFASVGITPSTINTSSAAQTITVTARITDDMSGLPTANGCCAYLTIGSPSGNRSQQVSIDSSKRVSGNAQDGTYRMTLTMPRYSEQGTWRLVSANLSDAAGHYRNLTASDFASPPLAASFEQQGPGDATPPVLAGLAVTPGALDTSGGSGAVTVSAHITDDVSGVGGSYSSGNVTFTSPSGNKTLQTTFDASKLVSGTLRDGTFESTLSVPRFSEQGSWRITSVYLSDAAYNSKTLSAADLSDAHFPTMFDQRGIGDATAPVLEDFSFTPGTIDTSSSAQIITVTAHVVDDISGLADTDPSCYCYGSYGANRVIFRSPSGNPRTAMASLDSSNRISGTALDGVYKATLVIPRYAEKGTWHAYSLNLVDVAGNSTSLSLGDLNTKGFPTSFTQSATGDSTAPKIASMSLAPATVDTSTSDQTVTITARITDDLSGLAPNNPSFSFTSPGLGQYATSQTDSTRLVSGNARDGVFEFDVAVPRFAEGGTWHLNAVYLVDAIGNSQSVAPADLSAAGFPTTFTVAALPPGAPTAVNAVPGNGSATVSWTAPAPNGASSVTSYAVTAYSGTSPVQTRTVAAPSTSTTITGLANGTPYSFTVKATNAAATGAPSAPSSPMTPRTVPGVPTGFSGTGGNGSASLNWTAPASDGGSAVNSYTVTTFAGTAAIQRATVTAPATTATITGLANGSTYTFSVAANNAAGAGPAATSDAVVPRAATVKPTLDPLPTLPLPGGPSIDTTAAGTASGYWMVGSDGRVYAFGDAPALGGPGSLLGTATAVDLEPTTSGQGYWVVDNLGRVYAYGAASHGNVDPARLAAGEKVISLSSTRSGQGYWIFTTKGRVLPFGDASFYGDMSAVRLNAPVIDSIPTPSGNGYYMVAADGGIFTFGDATFHGSMGGIRLNAPVQSLVPDGDNEGYWLVASDGGIFAFDAPFKGSLGAVKLNKPITGMVRYGEGYLMVAEDGGVFDFSGSPDGFKGSLGGNPPSKPIGSVAAFGS